MGKIKLTLSVEEKVVLMAKSIAKERAVSLSEMIESFLSSLQKDTLKNSEAETLKGIAKSKLSNMTDQEIKAEMLKDKFGI